MANSEKYVGIWKAALPIIEEGITHGINEFQLKGSDFRTAGDRIDYSFNLEIIDGNIPIKKGQAVARDFKKVFDTSETFKQFAKGKTLVVRLTKMFELTIR